MPPAGWALQATNASYTWKTATVGTPHGGTHFADVEYDPALVPQNEWLLSPVQNMAAGATTLSLWSQGSVYWCKTTYNNCDLEVWLVVGAIGGGDDVLLGLADDAWTASYTWAQSTFDITAQMPRNAAIGFRYVGTDGAQVGLDDVTLDGTLVPVGLQQFTIE
ncbi:MAG: choice-of-anchor J domain-containing protein [Acidobacteria bacterium]|nr:choice-of-anchor J domain-containing protein [Acidobacteriota bacterium]